MAVLTAAETIRLARMAGEYHKAAGDRMLTDAELDTLASEVALMKDEFGYTPADNLYTNTVDLYRAAAEAWRMKAGMVADGFDFQAEGASFTRSQVYDHYMQQAGRYAAMAHQLTVQVGERLGSDVDDNAFEEWLAQQV